MSSASFFLELPQGGAITSEIASISWDFLFWISWKTHDTVMMNPQESLMEEQL